MHGHVLPEASHPAVDYIISLQVVENGFDVLLVSQFTLFGKLKGNKLEFVKVHVSYCHNVSWYERVRTGVS
jgi:D-Tyr-tRNAtyr deacylase